jgi:hypothetical protein
MCFVRPIVFLPSVEVGIYQEALALSLIEDALGVDAAVDVLAERDDRVIRRRPDGVQQAFQSRGATMNVSDSDRSQDFDVLQSVSPSVMPPACPVVLDAGSYDAAALSVIGCQRLARWSLTLKLQVGPS